MKNNNYIFSKSDLENVHKKNDDIIKSSIDFLINQKDEEIRRLKRQLKSEDPKVKF